MALTAAKLVGRTAEVSLLDDLLAELPRGRSAAVEVAGEPGIGKTRLLDELARRADAAGQLVLSGSAAELERDLPFWVFNDALDDYVHGLEPRRLDALDETARAEIGHVLPSLRSAATTQAVERFRVHRAVRDLLELLARPKPLVLILDDVHWADSGSIDLLGALLRRPPERILLALAVRPRQLPERLAAALERAIRAGTLVHLDVAQLTLDEARELLDDQLNPDVYEQTGGNPFYLQQVARFPGRGATAALADELALVPASVRPVLEGAAVAGDPFEPELAAAAAGVSEPEALDALDRLLGLDLVRPTDVPRRFRFRHPLIRSAVYEAAPAGWRLAAHERCAAALAAQGAPAQARAHHVEYAGRLGDAEAIAVLREAGEAVAQYTPAGAGRWFTAALRLLPATAPAQERIGLLMASASAYAAAGRFEDAAAALGECEQLLPAAAADMRSDVINATALIDGLTGRHGTARRRLLRAVDTLDALSPPQAVRLLVHVGANALYLGMYDEAREWGERAHRLSGDAAEPALRAVSGALLAVACAMDGAIDEARRGRDEAAAILDAFSDHALAPVVGALNMLASAELYLGDFAAGELRAKRALAVARATGQTTVFPTFAPIGGWLLFTRGRLDEAAELLDAAVEAARLTGSTHALAWVLFTRAPLALHRGQLDAALADGEESIALSAQADAGIVPAWCQLTYATVLVEAGEPQRALELLNESVGGPGLPRMSGIWRVYFLDRFVPAWLELGRRAEAESAAATAEATAATLGIGFADAIARRARARILLDDDARAAADLALAAAAELEAVGAPLEAAISRSLAGTALAAAGEAERAADELEAAAVALESCGAQRYHAAAERELGKLGRRRHRRTRRGTGESGIESLTERELQIARLIVDRKTNPQIAAELFLSPKTVETHIRNLFHKLGVSSRVDVARAVERAER